MSRRHLLMLLLLASIWGSSFMFIKVALRGLEPSVLVAGRLVLAAATLVVVVAARTPLGEVGRAMRVHWRAFVFVSLLNSVVPFWFVAWGETRIDSGLAGLLQACTPLFSALLAAAFVPAERVGGLRLVGVLVGFGGVALLVGAVPSGDVIGAVAVVFSGFCYASSALAGARKLRTLPATTIAFGTTLYATAFSVPLALTQLPASVPSWQVIGSVAMLGIVGLGFAYILYFALIMGAGASRALLVTYLVPPMALFYGAVVLGESLDLTDIGGLVLILAGVALGTGSVERIRGRRARAVGAET